MTTRWVPRWVFRKLTLQDQEKCKDCGALSIDVAIYRYKAGAGECIISLCRNCVLAADEAKKSIVRSRTTPELTLEVN